MLFEYHETVAGNSTKVDGNFLSMYQSWQHCVFLGML